MKTIKQIAEILKEYKNDYEMGDSTCLRMLGININTKNNMEFEYLTINKKFDCRFVARRLKAILKRQ